MKLTQAQVKLIMETIYESQNYAVPVVFGNRVRMIRNEIEKDYLTCEEDRQKLYESAKGSPEKTKEANEEYVIILNSDKEYNIEPIPLDIQERADTLPLKFFLNLDPVLAK